MRDIQHIAMIMDGNGRWAKQQGMKRVKGHEKGAETVREITTYCAKIGIPYLTLYAFSTENWKRPKPEVEFLMRLLERYLKKELSVYMENGIRFETIGDISVFSSGLQKQIEILKQKTAEHTALTQTLALNYGAKSELVRAFKRLQEQGLEVSEDSIDFSLDSAFAPPVDLLIRTGGEQRISNFLLWQCAYAEFYFTPVLWPDFDSQALDVALGEFRGRERRFGGVQESEEDY